MSKTHWMLVSSADNFRSSERLGFTVQGIKSRHRKKAERMKPGDRILYYLTGVQAFAGTATIQSEYWEEHTPIWESTKDGEDYPFRVKISPDAIITEEADWIKAEGLLPRLEWVKKWPPEHWRLAFQGNVHVLPEQDFQTIEEEIKLAAKVITASR